MTEAVDPRFAQLVARVPTENRILHGADGNLGSHRWRDVATSLENYAALLRETGRCAEADSSKSQAETIRAKHSDGWCQTKRHLEK